MSTIYYVRATERSGEYMPSTHLSSISHQRAVENARTALRNYAKRRGCSAEFGEPLWSSGAMTGWFIQGVAVGSELWDITTDTSMMTEA